MTLGRAVHGDRQISREEPVKGRHLVDDDESDETSDVSARSADRAGEESPSTTETGTSVVDTDTGTPAAATGTGTPAPETTPVSPTDDSVEELNVRAIVVTISIATAAAVLANAVLLINFMHDTNNTPEAADWNMPWQAPVAMTLSIVALVTFGGFYIAARRARIAIAASFLLTFLVMLPFALTIPELGRGDQTDLARALIDQFGSVVSTVAVFYFGSEAVITGLKLWTTSQHPEAAALLARADRDLPPKNSPTTSNLLSRARG